MFIAVDPDSIVPPHAQIHEGIRSLIQSGKLRPSDPLPTVRQLAGDLNVAPNTVARAYTELQGDGWIVMDGRRGTRVCERSPHRDQRPRKQALLQATQRFIADILGRGYTKDELRDALSRELK